MSDDLVPRDMLDSMEEDYFSERERAEAARAEADRLRDLIAEHRTAIMLDIPCENANRRLWREAIGREDGDE